MKSTYFAVRLNFESNPIGFVYLADADADGGRGRGRRTRTQTLCIRRSLCRHVTIGTPTIIFAVLTVKNSQKTLSCTIFEYFDVE